MKTETKRGSSQSHLCPDRLRSSKTNTPLERVDPVNPVFFHSPSDPKQHPKLLPQNRRLLPQHRLLTCTQQGTVGHLRCQHSSEDHWIPLERGGNSQMIPCIYPGTGSKKEVPAKSWNMFFSVQTMHHPSLGVLKGVLKHPSAF